MKRWSRSWTAIRKLGLGAACCFRRMGRFRLRRFGSRALRQSLTGVYGWGLSPSCCRHGSIVATDAGQACPVEWVSGASMILRRTMLEQIGLLDEGLYTYCDDPDICLRARRAGWETWYVPESQVIHLEAH